MRLDRLQVDRYGPLAASVDFDADVQVVYGPNESGKTLLVESLVRWLTGDREAADARVDEEPEGFVVVETGDGERELSNGSTLLDHYESAHGLDVTPAEFRNVFVVRDGDLTIPDEADFYRAVTDRLVGIWTSDIEAVRDDVLARGRLAPGRWEVSDQYDDAAEQLELARELREDAAAYLADARERGVDTLERDCFRARAEVRRLEARVEHLEARRERAELVDLEKTAAAVERSLAERADLPSDDRLAELERRAESLVTSDRGEEALASDRRFYRRVTGGALAAGLVSFVAVLWLARPLVAAGAAAAFVLLAAYALAQARRVGRDLADRATERADLLALAERSGIDAYDCQELRAELADLRDTRDDLTQIITGKTEVLRDRLGLDAEAPRDVLDAATDAIAERRQALDDEALSGPPAVDLEGEDPGTAAIERALESARADLADARERLAERREALESHRRELQSFDERAAAVRFDRFLDEPFDLAVANTDALATLRDRLDAVVEAIETDADVSRAAATVLERMASAENEKLAELFADDAAAAVFERVTDGRYVDVRLVDGSRLVVEAADGTVLDPADLSRGTRDQLYLAVRVALGERLLEGRDGFFVFDDAFLTADPERMDRQAQVLDDLAREGWQVVYLTAKRDARDALTTHCDADVTELERL